MQLHFAYGGVRAAAEVTAESVSCALPVFWKRSWSKLVSLMEESFPYHISV